MNPMPRPLMRTIAPLLAARPHARAGRGDAPRWRRRLWSWIDAPVVLPWAHGLKVHAHPGDPTGARIFLTGTFEPHETRWLASRLNAGDTFIDVGAGQGMHTLLASRTVGDTGRVVAVEPDPPQRYRLLDNVAINGLSNVTVVPAAASDRPGAATTTVDRIVHEQGTARVNVIRVGARTALARVLRGAAQTIERFRPVLLIDTRGEALPPPRSACEDASHFLRDRGYDLRGFDAATGALLPMGFGAGNGPSHFAAIPPAAATRAAA